MLLLSLLTSLALADADVGVHGGARVGATWGASGLGLGPAARVDLGLVLNQDRLVLLPQLSLGVHQAATGGVVVSSEEDSWRWETVARGASVGLGLGLRIPDNSPRVHPELSAAVELHLVATTTQASGTGVQGTTATEVQLRPGGRAGAGLAIDAGPGEVLVEVSGGWVPVDGTLTGPAPGWRLLPSVGYRVSR